VCVDRFDCKLIERISATQSQTPNPSNLSPASFGFVFVHCSSNDKNKTEAVTHFRLSFVKKTNAFDTIAVRRVRKPNRLVAFTFFVCFFIGTLKTDAQIVTLTYKSRIESPTVEREKPHWFASPSSPSFLSSSSSIVDILLSWASTGG
jgi:hypothetical protein